MDLTTATPREIDEKLADLFGTLRAQYATRQLAFDVAHRMLGEKPETTRGGRIISWPTSDDDVAARLRNATVMPHEDRSRGQALTTIDSTTHEIKQLELETGELEAEFLARGGWSRFFSVEGGHIHYSRRCKGGTIRATTWVGWNPELSGKTMADAVAKLGENLCTHCFPDAPVAWRASDKKKVADGYCDGQGETGENLDMRYVSPRGNCPKCKQGTGISKTGRVLKHKLPQ